MVDHATSPTTGPAWMRKVERDVQAANSPQVQVPVGGMVLWASGGAMPPSWLPCDGSTYDPAEYPALRVALGVDSTPPMPNYSGYGWIIRAR